ncbi:MAG: nucleotide exchange factor GrpE [Bacteroidota bacterium]
MQNETEIPNELNNLEPVKSEIEILNEQIIELQNQTTSLKDQLLRKAAEFENFKRRTETDQTNFFKFASESIITEILPIVDDFARILKSADTHGENEQFLKGVELVYSKLMKLLEFKGVSAFETVGKEFNVDFHDALMLVPRADLAPNTIIEEIERGYKMHEKVIRHAKVIVSTLPESEEKI